MSWRRFFRRAKWDRERSAELDLYLQIETDENIARGMSPSDARRAAQRKLGNTLHIREEIYRMNTIGFLDSFARDLRYTLRGMRRRPFFTLAVVLTLALGIGANTAVFSVVNGVLIKPLPYPNADELVSIWHTAPGLQARDISGSPSMYFTYRDENRVFQNIGFWNAGGQTVTGTGEPEQVRTLWVTFGTLQALGIQPKIGRWFSEADDEPNTPGLNPVILSHGYWQRRFAGDPGVIGRELTIDARRSQIIGVMPPEFRFLNVDPAPELILTLGLNRSQVRLGNFGIQGIARLRPGVTLAEANADVKRMLPIWLNGWPAPPGAKQGIEGWKLTPALRPLKTDVVGTVADTLWVLMGTLGIVLLIACANVTNLTLVRSEGRQHEFAVRAALGAGRGRLVKELLTESLVFGIAGGAIGLAFAYAGLKLLVAIGPSNLPRLEEVSVDPSVLVFAAGASLVSGVVLGAITALKYAAHVTPVGAGTRGASASRQRQRLRNVLVIVQVALALVLLVSSGLMIRTFQALRSVNPGFTSGGEVQTARIWFPLFLVRDPQRYTAMQHDILDRISSIAGVDSAGIANSVPMDGRVLVNPVVVEDRVDTGAGLPPTRRWKYVSPGYFHAMGTGLIAGRDITWTDIDIGGKVAVISENLARELWREPAAAIGKRISEYPANHPPVWREVVGVVEDVHEDGPNQKAPAMVYWPIKTENFLGNPVYGTPAIAFVIRSKRAGSEGLLGEVRQAVWSVNPGLPVFLISTMKELYDRSIAQTSFALVVLAIAAAMALSLGIIGLYGVISYVVSQRSHEIGIRLALGADPLKLKRMFVQHGLALAGIGVAIGLGVAVFLSRLMSSLLFGISPLDPTTYAAVFGILLGAAALASYMPARRAARVDPVETLKAE